MCTLPWLRPSELPGFQFLPLPSATVTGESSTHVASEYLPGCASASRYTNGLSSEPTGRCASTARLKPCSSKLRLPTTATTSPLCTSVTIRPDCSGGRVLWSRLLSVRDTAASASPCADGCMPLITLRPAPDRASAG